jgi:hypothetical protein
VVRAQHQLSMRTALSGIANVGVVVIVPVT